MYLFKNCTLIYIAFYSEYVFITLNVLPYWYSYFLFCYCFVQISLMVLEKRGVGYLQITTFKVLSIEIV